jgi:hypothetical protein
MSRSGLNSDHLSPAHSLTKNKFACEDASSSHIILYIDKLISLPTLESMFFTFLTTSLATNHLRFPEFRYGKKDPNSLCFARHDDVHRVNICKNF